MFLDTVLQLTRYSNDSRRVEIKKALKMAKMILNGLKSVNLTTKTMEIENFLELVFLLISPSNVNRY